MPCMLDPSSIHGTICHLAHKTLHCQSITSGPWHLSTAKRSPQSKAMGKKKQNKQKKEIWNQEY